MARIVICEDDPHLLDFLELTLTMEGHQVETLTNGAHAITRLDEPAVDLVLLDVMLPDADGLQVLRKLRATPTWRDTHVIIITALDNDHDIWQGWSNGADYYLTKPFDADHLTHVIHRLLALGQL